MKAPAFIQTINPAPVKSLKPFFRLLIGLLADAKFALLQRIAATVGASDGNSCPFGGCRSENTPGRDSDFGFCGWLAPIC